MRGTVSRAHQTTSIKQTSRLISSRREKTGSRMLGGNHAKACSSTFGGPDGFCAAGRNHDDGHLRRRQEGQEGCQGCQGGAGAEGYGPTGAVPVDIKRGQ